MIYYAMVIRSRDGLTLSASTESETLREVREAKGSLKMLARKIKSFPDRCTLRLNPHVIYFITSLGVSYVLLCEANYPCVLAFSFLNELMKEFIVLYNTSLINNVVRPYSLMEFDNTIYKLRQRYNSPRTLTTKLNLHDLSTEIKLRPPHLLSVHNIMPQNHQANGDTLVNFSSRPSPVSWLGILSMTPSGFCALFNIVRGLSALSESKLEEYEGSNALYGFSFLFEAFFQAFFFSDIFTASLSKEKNSLDMFVLPHGLCTEHGCLDYT